MAYPPAVGVVGPSQSCLTCHVDNGPWKDDSRAIIDIVDKKTGESFMQEDGTFLISIKKGEIKTVLTIIGRAGDDEATPAYRNGWLYVSPDLIGTPSFNKFATGWNVNLHLGCRLLSDKHKNYPGARITAAGMRLSPGEDAQDAEIMLQVMMTSGESVKGKPKEGLTVSYFERVVLLRVIE